MPYDVHESEPFSFMLFIRQQHTKCSRLIFLLFCFTGSLLFALCTVFCFLQRARAYHSFLDCIANGYVVGFICVCDVHDVCVAKFCFTPSSFSTFCVCNDVQVLHILPKLLLAKCMFPLYLFTRAQSSCERAHSRIGLFRSPFTACVVESAFALLHHPNETVANVYTALGLP